MRVVQLDYRLLPLRRLPLPVPQWALRLLVDLILKRLKRLRMLRRRRPRLVFTQYTTLLTDSE